MALLAELKKEATLLVVSHDLADIAPLVDCAWRMEVRRLRAGVCGLDWWWARGRAYGCVDGGALSSARRPLTDAVRACVVVHRWVARWRLWSGRPTRCQTWRIETERHIRGGGARRPLTRVWM